MLQLYYEYKSIWWDGSVNFGTRFSIVYYLVFCVCSSQLSLAHFVAKAITEKSNRRDCLCHTCGCVYTNRTIHILSECHRTPTSRNRLIDNIDSKYRAMISVPVWTMNSKDFACVVLGNVYVKLNSDDHSTELMDILFRYVKLAFTIYNGHMYI